MRRPVFVPLPSWSRARPTLPSAALALALAGAPVSAMAADSAYTTLDWEDGCRVLDAAPPDGPGAWAHLRCAGLHGRPVFVSDADQRMSVWYGPRAGKVPWHSFSGFNHVHDVIEWRGPVVEGRVRPQAVIQRWFVADGRGGERQVLVVSTVARGPDGRSCPAGYVDANANADANARARHIADAVAPGFRCGRDTPRYHGRTTARTPNPS